ncbi:hybrid sensor histidine kinase/response regulator [Marinobacter sp.]|uniref:hybrid sensor histidine kinase/response regulator n=1 Tax=Marinobacter sp. TaxID=50741 RepID=UPI0019F80EF4|nr:hybrid sensor histidine kinase/response regulator [Marinobacter sp.]MBE0485475.1 response regulator [Marinobacter sp.]
MKILRSNLSSIQSQIIIGGLLPLLLVALILGFLAARFGVQDQKESMESQAALIADNIAQVAGYYLFSGDDEILRQLIEGAVNSKWVSSAVIVDQNEQIRVRVGPGFREADKTAELFVREIAGPEAEVTDDLYQENSISSSPKQAPIGWVMLEVDMAEMRAANQQVIARSLWALAIGSVFSLLVSVYLSRRFVKPISAVTKTIQQIADGDLSARVNRLGRGEIVRLVTNVNSMAETIESSQHELQQRVAEATSSLEKKVAELEQRNTELDAARTRANKAEKVKANFLANMSHEIRTPVNAIYGFSQRILKPGSAAETREYVEMMSRAAKLLIHLIDGILGFSKAESNTIRLNESIFDIRRCLENMATIFSTEAQQKGLELVALIDSDVPEFIKGDELRIEQVLANLLANAIKFTEDGHVVLRASVVLARKQLKISVTDTGIGIPPDEIASRFKVFEQGDSTATRNFGGVGLGLAICKNIMDLMGGSISVESEPGHGSEFSFHLPINTDIKPELPVQAELARFNVLVFEPHALVLHSVKNNLVMQGVTVFTARNNEVACRILSNRLPDNKTIDVVIIGLSPRSDSDAANRARIRTVREHFSGPVLLMATSHHSDLDLSRDVEGKVRVLVKPARSDILIARLSELFSIDSPVLSKSPTTARVPGFLSGLTVLVAEDNEFNRRLIESWLIDWGARVVLARDGNEAVERALVHQVDLVLMDLHMPNLDGGSALKQLRALHDKTISLVPVVIVTADVFGANDYLEKKIPKVQLVYKPINANLLARTIARMLGLRYPESAIDPNEHQHLLPDRLRAKLHQEFERLGGALQSAVTDQDQTAIRDLLHQIQGIAGYFQFELLRQRVDRCRQAFETGSNQQFGHEAQQLLALLDKPDAGSSEDTHE